MYTGNSYEDRVIGTVDRLVGARVSGKSFGNVEYTRSSNLVFRNGQWVDPKPTQTVRPVAPVVKKATPPVVVKVAEVEAPKPIERELWELEQAELGRRTRAAMEEARHAEEKEAWRVADEAWAEYAEAERREEARLDVLCARADARKEAQLQKEKERQRRLREAEKSAKAAAQRREQEEKRRAAYRSSVVAAKVDKRAEMLARVDRLHWESCQALATQYVREGCHPNDIHWTVAALRSMVHQATDEGLRMIELCYLHQTERMSEKLFAREAERAAK